MAQDMVRICNEHDVELRQLGARWVCPRGHSCDLDWTLKPRPAVQPEAPHVVSKAIDPKPKKETPMPTKTQHPHGTHQRYFQEAKSGEGTCDACKKAAAKYSKERRQAKLKAAGKPATRRDAVQHRATKSKTSPPRRPPGKAIRVKIAEPASRPFRTLKVPFVPAARPGDLEVKIFRLREELAAAEVAFFHHVRAVLPDVAR